MNYRPEIQGLRAVAALLVAIYHVWFGRVSGGVDVFFVVSGFLITHSLLNQRERMGRPMPLRFLWDLYSRLGPPAMLVIAATALGAALFLPHTDWPFNINEALTATFFVNNWHLAFNAIDYLDRGADPRPFQHIWALSAQWQFYFLWAGLFVVVHAFAPSRFRTVLRWTVVAAFVASFAHSVYMTAHNQSFAYFSSATRVWEFAAGALLALQGRKAEFGSWAGVALGWVGLAAIIACGALLPVASSFPGYAALVPVVAALLILRFGSSQHPASVRRLLSSRPLVAFGAISYPFYLWHWPLLVLWLSYTVEAHAGLIDGAAILAAALVLSILTHRLMQARPGVFVRPSAGGISVALVGVTLFFCLGWRAESLAAKSVQLAEPTPPTTTHPGALAVGRRVAPQPVFPGPFRVKYDYSAAHRDNCTQTTLGADVIHCEYGDLHGKLTIAMIGNSHVTHWLPALDAAGKERGWKVVLITKNDCRLRERSDHADDDAVRSCDEWNERLPQVVHDIAPDYLFTLATVRVNGAEVVPLDMPAAWARLMPDLSRVIAVRGTPRFAFDVATCVDLHGPDSSKCTSPRSLALADNGTDVRAQVASTGARYADLTSYFCDAQRCFPVAGNVLIYRDHSHLTAAYVGTMKDALAEVVQSAMTQQ